MRQNKTNKISKIEKINKDNLSVVLIFNEGQKRTVSLAKYFSQPKGLAAEIMRGNMFDKCFIETGALAWPNGLEFCADALWILSQQPNQRVA